MRCDIYAARTAMLCALLVNGFFVYVHFFATFNDNAAKVGFVLFCLIINSTIMALISRAYDCSKNGDANISEDDETGIHNDYVPSEIRVEE
ncbi:hypothetical protein VCHA53O466_50419 [Vibrio chagasii]|nr:hypothetical protein VCHA53O466_50419 [Vibrio chagasii]